ncbi:MAG TPA: RAMP superfamily CRISPR-associated protein [Candidatus Limnocylindrales bacterium]|nr:RAMP superfamily CRISPR-associated protein [Candidatus Limnocylindrales bacterium]
MTKSFWSPQTSRKIISRIVVEGDLVLQTPAHFSNGDTDELTDMPLLVDPLDGKTPLLTGASVTGALRSYLRERERGYGQPADSNSASVRLFGSLKRDEEGEQSPLIVEDALGKPGTFGIEMRNGVSIDPKSRTAREDRLFDLQLWQAGTTFPLRFELLIREGDNADILKRGLATALAGFNDGSIMLGARKRRGYGRVSVSGWRVKTYDLTKPDGLLDWIEKGDEPLSAVTPIQDIGKALGVTKLEDDRREFFHINATFALNGSLLIRSGSGQDDQGPDMVHLHARQADGTRKPILSGTSLVGVLRARALKIANTLDTQDRAQTLIDEMFGADMDEVQKRRQQGNPDATPLASRVMVTEIVVQNARTDLVQNRVSIDRFTAGARETALFNEQPAFGGHDTTLTVDIRLVNPKDYEIGLLLLLLKDLWTGDLPLGGESSVGRGRLKGNRAILTFQGRGTSQRWEIGTNGQDLTVMEDREALEKFVSALSLYLKGGRS